MYSDISQLIRDVVVLSRKGKDIELKSKINQLLIYMFMLNKKYNLDTNRVQHSCLSVVL